MLERLDFISQAAHSGQYYYGHDCGRPEENGDLQRWEFNDLTIVRDEDGKARYYFSTPEWDEAIQDYTFNMEACTHQEALMYLFDNLPLELFFPRE